MNNPGLTIKFVVLESTCQIPVASFHEKGHRLLCSLVKLETSLTGFQRSLQRQKKREQYNQLQGYYYYFNRTSILTRFYGSFY